jgi:hypothetical protein
MLKLSIVGKMFATKVFSQCSEEVKIAWGKVWTVGWVIQKLQLES